MKRSPAPSSCSSSSSTSSSLGSDDVPPHHQSRHEKPKSSKRNRKSNPGTQDKCQNASSPNTSARRSSVYRGVTRHRLTGRFEAHLWDKSSWNNIQTKKGKQVYLGAYDDEEAAAHSYDLAALKYWGTETTLNFPIETYTKEIEEMQKSTKEEYLASLRRRSSGFSRGVSKYRGVARHHHNGRWEARIGRVYGNKYLYLGTYNTQEEAAAAYDMAAIEYRGPNAVTNFDISNYVEKLKNKGIPVDQILQEPNSSSESEFKQPPPCADSALPAMTIMDPIHDHELSWSFFFDSGLNAYPLSDLPIEQYSCKLSDLFDDTGFVDDIDFIFDHPEYAQEKASEYGVPVVGVPNSMEDGNERSLSSSSTSDTTTMSTTIFVS